MSVLGYTDGYTDVYRTMMDELTEWATMAPLDPGLLSETAVESEGVRPGFCSKPRLAITSLSHRRGTVRQVATKQNLSLATYPLEGNIDQRVTS